MKSLRANLISPFYPYQSGVATYSEDLASFLEAAGVGVHRVNDTFWSIYNFFPSNTSKCALAAQMALSMSLSYFYKKPNSDRNKINHFQLSGGPHNYVILKDFYKLRGPRVVTVHEDFFWTRKFLKPLDEIERLRVIRESDAVFVHTQELKDKIGFINKNVHVIHHGVDLKKFDPELNNNAKQKLELKGVVIAHIGFLFRYKGVEDFIKAVQGIDATILVVGSGPAEAEMKRLSSFLDPYKIIFIPYISEEKYPLYISAADVIVFPRSHSKGECSGVLVQAMASGKALVAYDTGCFKEYLAAERGVLVEPNNIAELHNAINNLVENKEKIEIYGKKSREFAIQHLDWNIVAAKHKVLYEQLLG